MKRILYFLLLVAPLILGSCANRAMYTSRDFSAKAQAHQTIAILPFETIINLRPNQLKQLGPYGLKELEEKEAFAAQNVLYSYFLREKGKDGFNVAVQDIHKTNTLLYREGITQDNLRDYTYEELAKLLEVDAIVSSTLKTDKPVSDGAALAINLALENYYVPTNAVTASIAINDGHTGELLWRYHKSLDRGLGSDTYTIIDTIMRKASKKLPY